MEGIEKLYYTISEVSEQTGIKQYVLRYWESEFPELQPIKNRSGNRVYTKEDIDVVMSIRRLLYEEKYTIEGAKQRLKTGVVRLGAPEEARSLLQEIKSDVKKLLGEE